MQICTRHVSQGVRQQSGTLGALAQNTLEANSSGRVSRAPSPYAYERQAPHARHPPQHARLLQVPSLSCLPPCRRLPRRPEPVQLRRQRPPRPCAWQLRRHGQRRSASNTLTSSQTNPQTASALDRRSRGRICGSNRKHGEREVSRGARVRRACTAATLTVVQTAPSSTPPSPKQCPNTRAGSPLWACPESRTLCRRAACPPTQQPCLRVVKTTNAHMRRTPRLVIQQPQAADTRWPYHHRRFARTRRIDLYPRWTAGTAPAWSGRATRSGSPTLGVRIRGWPHRPTQPQQALQRANTTDSGRTVPLYVASGYTENLK